MADRPHRDSAVGDPDWFTMTPRERTDRTDVRRRSQPPPRRRGQPPAQQPPSRHAQPEPRRADLTGRQPGPRPYAAGPNQHQPDEYQPERAAGRQRQDHVRERYSTGTRQPGDGRGQPPAGRRRAATAASGVQPAAERPRRARPHETTGSYTPDPRYSTGQHPVTGRYATAGQHDQRYTTGQQPYVEPHATGQQPYVDGYSSAPDAFGGNTFGHPGTGSGQPQPGGSRRPAAEPQVPAGAARDPRWSTGPQPAGGGGRGEPQRHHQRDTTGGYSTGDYAEGHRQADPYAAGQHADQYASDQYAADEYALDQYAADEYALDHRPGEPRHPARDQNAARTRLREKKARQRQRSAVVAKVSAAALAVIVLLVTGYTWGAKKWLDVRFRQVSALDLGSSAVVNPAAQLGDDNFLIVGLDGRPGADTEDPAGGARSDIAMVVHVPQDHGRVVVVSFPRTLLVDRPACEGWDQDGGRYTGQQDPGQPKARIATAYRTGGPRCATRVVQQLSGLAINHFVSVDFSGFRSMVDATGGVQLCVEQPVRDGVLGDVVPAPGTVRLGGDQALSYLRAWHLADDPSGESGRVLRQQQLLAAVARAAVTSGALANPGRLIDAIADNTFVDNVDAGQLQELAGALDGMDPGRVTFVTVPAGEPDADGNQALRAEDASALFAALVDGDPLAGEQPAASAPQPAAEPQPATVPPAEIKLQVQNASGEDGLATQIAKRLRGVGFEVVQLGNAEHAERTVIRFSAAREAQARSVSAAVPRAALELDPTLGGAIQVVLGSNFDGVIAPVQLGQPVAGQPVQQAQPAGAPIALQTVNAAETGCE